MPKYHYDSRAKKKPAEDEEREDVPEYTSLNEIVSTRLLPAVSGPPRSEEEKRNFFTNLVRLKSQRMTHAQCAELLAVSERSIATYINDPLYKEIQADLITDAKDRGHVLISEVIDDAIGTIYSLMQVSKSDFVRFKAAEKILTVAGYDIPRDEVQSDSREGVIKFLEKVAARQNQQPQVNISITTDPPNHHASQIIDAEVVEHHDTTSNMSLTRGPGARGDSLPAELQQYYEPVLPGGKLPGSSAPDPHLMLMRQRAQAEREASGDSTTQEDEDA
jgi:hypothetical protein